MSIMECASCGMTRQNVLVKCKECEVMYCNCQTTSSDKSCALSHFETEQHSFQYKFSSGKNLSIECLACKSKNLQDLIICSFKDKFSLLCNNCVKSKLQNKSFEQSKFVEENRFNSQIVPFDTSLNEDEEIQVDNSKLKQLMRKSKHFIVIPDVLDSTYSNLKCYDGSSAKKHFSHKQEKKSKSQPKVNLESNLDIEIDFGDCESQNLSQVEKQPNIVEVQPKVMDCVEAQPIEETVKETEEKATLEDYFLLPYQMELELQNQTQSVEIFPTFEIQSTSVFIKFESNLLLTTGNFYFLELKQGLNFNVPCVCHAKTKQHVVLKAKSANLGRFDSKNPFKAYLKEDHISLQRIQEALKLKKVDKEIKEVILGSAMARQMYGQKQIEDLYEQHIAHIVPKPDMAQQKAIIKCVQSQLGLINGCFGGGKTQILLYIVKLLQELKRSVLVVTATNSAADNVYERLRLLTKCIRVPCVTQLLDELEEPQCYYAQMFKQKLGNRQLQRENGLDFGLLKKIHREILQDYQVVVSTAVNSGDIRLGDAKFDSLVVDEAGQILEPECLLAVNHHVTQIIQVGDINQMGPLILNNLAKKCHFGRSMFERLQKTQVAFSLEFQYRMPQRIAQLANSLFYQGRLRSGLSDGNQLESAFLPISFVEMRSTEQISSQSQSSFNQENALFILKLVKGLQQKGIKKSQIQVLSPYRGQVELLQALDQELLVSTIDSFQGKQADYVVLDTVKSAGSGFLSDQKRLNVAVTRMKQGLIVLGAEKTFQKEVGRQFVQWFKDNGCYVMQK